MFRAFLTPSAALRPGPAPGFPLVPADTRMVSADQRTWLVCHTRPRCEKKFAHLLTVEGIGHYLPLIDSVRRYAGQTKQFTKPLFTGYVFAHVPHDLRHRLYQQDLLARIITVPHEETFLQQLEAVKQVLASGRALFVRPLLERGRHVRILGGPLHGLEGFVADHTPDVVIVAVDILQQGLHVKVAGDRLQPL